VDEAHHPDAEAVIDAQHLYPALDDVGSLDAQQPGYLALLLGLQYLSSACHRSEQVACLAPPVEPVYHRQRGPEGVSGGPAALAGEREDLAVHPALQETRRVHVAQVASGAYAYVASVAPHGVPGPRELGQQALQGVAVDVNHHGFPVQLHGVQGLLSPDFMDEYRWAGFINDTCPLMAWFEW